MRTFLITRPAHQAQNLVDLIKKGGDLPIILPVIDIIPRVLSTDEKRVLANWSLFDILIFISANAVYQSLPLMQTIDQSVPQFYAPKLAVIGPATDAALQKFGYKADIFSLGEFNSEGLLQHPELQDMSGKKVLIFRGVGGRTLLRETLTDRGAKVTSLATYQRNLPKTDMTEMRKKLQKRQINGFVAMSNESLLNLSNLVGVHHLPLIKRIPMVVISRRTANLALQMGFEISAIIAQNASDTEVYQSLRRLPSNKGSPSP